MTDKLPDNLLRLFVPRPPLRYMPPVDKAPTERTTVPITGLASVLERAKEVDAKFKDQERLATESPLEKQIRDRAEKAEQKLKLATKDGLKAVWRPQEDPNIKGDPHCTLIVARLDYKTTEDDIKRAFAFANGRQAKVKIIENKHAKPTDPPKKRFKGYAFVEFRTSRDAKEACNNSRGLRILNREVVVDIMRGGVDEDFKPMRAGGGLGGRHYTKAHRGGFGARYGPPSGPNAFSGRGGYRGGYGGGRGGRGGYGGGRGGFDGERRNFDSRAGIGYQNGAAGPPDGAPSGPRGPQFGRQGPGGYRGGRDGGFGGGRFEDRPRNGPTGGNREPVGPRGGGGGYRDRDRDGGQPDYDRDRDPRESRKRTYDGDAYDDPRTKRRY